MEGKINKLKTWKEDPIFVFIIWGIILGLAPAWIPIHIVLRILDRRGFITKGYYEFPGYAYTWVVDLSSDGVKKVEKV